MEGNERTITIEKIEICEKGITVWDNAPDYHYYGDLNYSLRIGDKIIVEPYGVNFGYIK